MPASSQPPSFVRRNGLSLAFLGLMLVSLVGHALTGWHVENNDRQAHGESARGLGEYLVDDHFLSSLFENWESEFLQMGLFVLLTAKLRQKGASESRPFDEAEGESASSPTPRAEQPWPVRRGGVWLRIYEHSLSGALFLLFALSFAGHFVNSWELHNSEQRLHGGTLDTMASYIGGSEFWFESFQNWQSEFLSVVALVLLSIMLREKDSTESKDVEAPHSQTGD